MELTKKHKWIIGGLALIGGAYLLNKKAIANKANTANNTPTPAPNTPIAPSAPTPTKTAVVVRYKAKMNRVYEGQALYGIYDNKETTGYGFLEDGTEINYKNAILVGEEYKKRPDGNNDYIAYYTGRIAMDGVWKSIYSQWGTKILANYGGAIGFTDEGYAVFVSMIDEAGLPVYGYL